MPKVAFSEEYKTTQSNKFDFPKLKLKNGEQARLLLIDKEPVLEFVHTLRKPQVINGIPVTFQAERRDKTTYTDYKKDFVSQAICFGDFGTLQDKGTDPKNCPMCQAAHENPDWFDAPKARYAAHVIRYKTKAGTFNVTQPFSVDLLVWAFSGTVFNKIYDLQSEWGDLWKHDLTLGPCTSENFQKFDINIAQKAEWLADKQRQELVKDTFKNNKLEDLSLATGSRKERRWIDADIATVKEAWGQVNGSEKDNSSVADDLSALFDGEKNEPKTEWAPSTEDINFAETDEEAKFQMTPQDDAENSEPEVEDNEPNFEASDFDDLLSSL